MHIAIIGTGTVGVALAGSLLRAGHQVTLAARDADKTRQVSEQVGANPEESTASAVAGAEVAILAVPHGNLDEVAQDISATASGKVVIDVTNPGPTIGDGPSGAERLAEQLPGAHVAKAFNTLFGSFMADPQLKGQRVDALFATDSDEARRVLGELLSSLGFRPLHAGGLSVARQMEAMAWLNIQLQMRYGGDWGSTFVMLGAPEAAVAEPAKVASS